MSVSCSEGSAPRRGRRGFVQMFGALVLSFILIPAAGLAIDVGMMYLVQSLLSAASDGAALAGARAFSRGSDDGQQRANAEATANAYLRANFPSGYMWSTDLTVNSQAATEASHVRSLTTTASVRLPLIFLRLFRTESTLVSTASKATRRDANVMFVMDRSTSLQLSGSCTVLKNAAKNFVDRFAEGRDNIGLVTFGTSSRVDNALSTTFKTAIKTTLNNVSCNGATNTSQALWQAYTELVALNQPGALNAILLFTDGLPTAVTQMFAIQSVSHCTDKTAKQGAAYAVTSGTNPSGLYPWIGTVQPMASDLNLLQTPTTNNCYFRSRATDLYRDVVAVPLTDTSGNSLDTTGYMSVSHITGGIRLTDFNHGATNAADHAALRIRRGDPVTGGQSLAGVVIYTIGYMDVDETLLKRMSNDASLSPNPVAAGTPGKYRYAGDASQLNDAFMSVASEVLRLAQ